MATGRYLIDGDPFGGNYPTTKIRRARVETFGTDVSLRIHTTNQYGQAVSNRYMFTAEELEKLVTVLLKHQKKASEAASYLRTLVVEG